MTDIERLRELLAKATPGPWHVAKDGFGKAPNGPTVYAAGADLNYVAKCMDFANTGPTLNLENAELIAEAITALPTLLADYERLRGMEERVKGVESLLRKSAAEHEESCGARRGLDDASRNFHEGLSQAYEDGADMLAVELGFANGTGKPVALVPVPGGEGNDV